MSDPGSDIDESSDLTDGVEDEGQGDTSEEDREGAWPKKRVEDKVDSRDSCDDLEGGMSIPSNFTLCLN